MPLTLTNNALRLRIGEYAGYGSTVSSFDSDQAARVERWLEGGKRSFYSNEMAHHWSFLSPTRNFVLASGQYGHSLPADFAVLRGPITFAASSGVLHKPIEITSPERVQRKQQVTESSGVPCLCAVRPKVHNEGDFLEGMHYELIVWPTPSQAYAVDLCYGVNPYAPDGNSVLPIGDAFHVETLLTACLAQVDEFNGVAGAYAEKFASRLQASVAHDLKVACPDTLGVNTDKSDREYPWGSWRDLNVYTVDPPAAWTT